MTLKDKAKTYNFWISIVSAVVLIVRIIGDKFNIFIDTSLIMDVTTGLCSIFVILGILSAPKSTTTKSNESYAVVEFKPNNDTPQEEQKNTFNTEQLDQETANSDKVSTEAFEGMIAGTNFNSTSNTEKNNETNPETLEEVSLLNKQDENPVSIYEIIEKLKAEIHEANKVIAEFSKDN